MSIIFPKVSVIIPCFNHGQYIDQAVESVLAQTFQDFEVIIINDGSTDKFTNELLEKYNKPKTKVITTNNRGLASARNTGISEARGDYILPLDADDYIGGTYLESAVKILDDRQDVKIVYCMAEKFGMINEKWKLKSFSLEKIYLMNLIFCSAFFRKSDWEKAGGYNIELTHGYEDWDFWLSILDSGGNVYQIPDILFYYRIRNNSMVSQIDWKKEIYLRNKIFWAHQKTYKKLKIRFQFIKATLNVAYSKFKKKVVL